MGKIHGTNKAVSVIVQKLFDIDNKSTLCNGVVREERMCFMTRLLPSMLSPKPIYFFICDKITQERCVTRRVDRKHFVYGMK